MITTNRAGGDVSLLLSAPEENPGRDPGKSRSHRSRLVAPSPFTAGDRILWHLDEPGRATVTVYDMAGRRVARIVDGWLDAGTHHATWATSARPGVYFMRLEVGDEVSSRSVARLGR